MTTTDTDWRIHLSALEFDVLTEHLRLETMPLVLKVPSPGRTHTERAKLAEKAWRSLTARDLGRPTRIDPELEWMLRLLAQPECEVDGRIWMQRSVRVLAAAGSGRAVLARKEDDGLRLRPASARGLCREAVSVLPPLSSGPGRSVSLRSADLDNAADEAGGNTEDLTACLQRRGVRPDDAETLTSMVGGTTTMGQFGAATRNRHGRRVRADHVVGVFDTALGRYIQLRRPSVSGEQWSTIAPVDDRRLIRHIEQLLTGVPDNS